MTELKIGDPLAIVDANENFVSGCVEKFLGHTVIIVDQNINRFLIKKEQIAKLGFSCPDYRPTIDNKPHV